MTKLETIEEGIKSLPLKDQSIARTFIQKRQFDDLRHLVKSAIVLTNKYRDKPVPNSDKVHTNYENVSIEGMENMLYELENYIELIYE